MAELAATSGSLVCLLAIVSAVGCASSPPAAPSSVATAEVPTPGAAPAAAAEAAGSRGGPGLLGRIFSGDARMQDCNRFIATVNESPIGDGVNDGAVDFDAERKRALELERKLAVLEVTDPRVVELVALYRDNVKGYAATMQVASKTAKGDRDGLLKLVQRAGEVSDRSKEVITQINGYCAKVPKE